MEIEQVLCNEARVINPPTESRIYVWGYNERGQTGRNDKHCHLRIPKSLPPKLFKFSQENKNKNSNLKLRWLDIACGREHTAAVSSDGSLFTWGSNEFGELGDGTEKSRKDPKIVKRLHSENVKWVSCGAHCTAAITEPKLDDASLSKNQLWVWGQNQGSNYPKLFRGAFGPNTVFRQVSCGATHVVALSQEGLLQAWGYNEWGQLGRGFTCEGLQGPCVLNAYAKCLDEAPEQVNIVQVSCGEFHTAAISDNGEVYTWGRGNMGQLGHCSLQSLDKELIPRRVVSLEGTKIKEVSCGGVHTCALTSKGALYSWGGGHMGQIGAGPIDKLFSDGPDDMFRNVPIMILAKGVELVGCGHSHTLVSMRDGRIYGWGYNGYGQAASLKSTYSPFPSPLDWCVGEVRRVAAGGGHSAVLTDACSLKELCEFRLAESVNITNAFIIEDVASRISAASLARLCQRLREHSLEHDECHCQEEITY